MNSQPIRFLLSSVLFTAIGLAGGFLAASQKTVSSGHGHGHGDHADHEEHDAHEGHDQGDENTLSMQALKNLKVRVETIDLSNHTSYRSIPASLHETPKTTQPIFAPYGGTVQSIHVEHGEMVKRGSALITLMRDAIPRPQLTLTQNLLDPENRLKGLTLEDLTQLDTGDNEGRQQVLWQKALMSLGYWDERSDQLLQSLPSSLKGLSFTVAVLGELSANGYLKDNLVAWIGRDSKAASHFLEISSLILQGMSLSQVQHLSQVGALEDTVVVRVPPHAKDYDVHHLTIRLGDQVKRGQVLGELHNPRELHIEAHARGSEVPVLMAALQNSLTLSAVPLTRGAGPTLEGLTIRNILDGESSSGASVHLEIDNNPSVVKTGEGGRQFRSWQLRVESRYVLRVPRDVFEDVFVVPANAVVEDGADKIVFLQTGSSFAPAKVVVLYQNDDVAVLGPDSELFPGEPVVVEGAFALGLALKAQKGGGVDAHAGHSH